MPSDYIRIKNQRNGQVLADRAETAHSLIGRVAGLIGRHSLPQGSALIIPGCRQVHTFFMRFSIDVVFVDAAGEVVCTAENIRPYRVSCRCRSAVSAIEALAGSASACGVKIGDILSIEGLDK